MQRKKPKNIASPKKPDQGSSRNLEEPTKRITWIILGGIIALTFLVSIPALRNGLLAWDDEPYLTKNQLVQSGNLWELFTQPVMGNYHPLTMLTLALEYRLFGSAPAGYHGVNLLLHLINVVLVFIVIKRLNRGSVVALVTALLFGIHPLHVESVAWVAELKDLLYTLFFLLSCIFYLKYLEDKSRKYFFITLLFFTASLLSKAMAVSLPVVLLLIDYFRGRKFSKIVWLEKIPFFVLSLLFGIIAIIAQGSTEAIADHARFSFFHRIVFASCSFLSYLGKLLLPVNLSAFYPYPVRSGDLIPGSMYLCLFIMAALVAVMIYSFRRSRDLFFGLVFFTITIFLVLQLLPVGNAMMADRYSYIPSIGIFFLAGVGVKFLWDKGYRYAIGALLIAFTLFFGVQTFLRCTIWKDDLTLWNDVIKKDPAVEYAYNNRGIVLMNQERYDESVSDFTRAIELNPVYPIVFLNRGIARSRQNKHAEAIADFDQAINLKPENPEAWFNRGVALRNVGRNEEALRDFQRTLELKPQFPMAYYNRGTLYMNLKRYPEAIVDFTNAIKADPAFADSYLNRGVAHMIGNEKMEALQDFNKAIDLKPGFINAYYNRGNYYLSEKKYREAIADYTHAIELKTDYSAAYYNRGLAAFYEGNKQAACDDFKKAATLDFTPAKTAISQLCE
ncbi:MAG: tetratricopeptide repeat protein [Alphaproteobacteria bacterium]|nr:tetratricopeptide repeat protein [Alphaproteobacteria bacterium]